MRPPKINDRALLKLIDAQEMSQSEAAKELGVSRQAVSARLKELRGRKTRVAVVKKVEEAVDYNIDAVKQLSKINEYANELLDLLMRWNRGDDEALQILETQVKTKKVRVGDEIEFIREFKFKDPRQMALQAMGEIRNQLKLQLEIFQCLYDMQAVQEFQEEVLNAISEVDPSVRARILQNLGKKRALRSAVKLY
jgi:predicted transcriptional regulator